MKIKNLLFPLLLVFMLCVACSSPEVEAKDEKYNIEQVLDNVYYIECDEEDMKDALKYLDENYRFYKVVDIEIVDEQFTSSNRMKGVLVAVSQN